MKSQPGDFARLKAEGRRITMLTAYDAPLARLLADCGVDLLLVGDSVGTNVLGYGSVHEVTLGDMLHHVAAVRRGAPEAFVCADVPEVSMRRNDAGLLADCRQLLAVGADSVKIEAHAEEISRAELLVQGGVPVIGHVGHTPQTAEAHGGLGKVQGKSAAAAIELLVTARALESVGCFMLLAELVPVPVAAAIARAVRVPLIGIGAGPGCDGQVLVVYDLFGLSGKRYRFLKDFGDVAGEMRRTVERYLSEVRSGAYPEEAHTYPMKPEEQEKFAEYTRQRGG